MAIAATANSTAPLQPSSDRICGAGPSRRVRMPAVTRRLIHELSRRPEPGSSIVANLEHLTDREREVLLLIATGLSNAELAAHLHLSLATVKTHIGRLLAKLHARDRAQLVIAAYENGVISPRLLRMP
jgi:DNA-binding NarL/FixJ family response regulator